MPLPPAFLDDLRTRVPVSEVVGGRVRLTRAGHEFKGLCPFHKEKSPSFTVNDQKGFFHCFGCGAHGDAIGFLMQHDNLPFMEAVEQLAGRAGLQVPQATPEEHERFERQRGLHDLAEAACTFFEARLREPGGRAALSYLKDRGLDDETLDRFRLGYAPADSQALLKSLTDDGFEIEAMIELGLARRPDDGRPPYAFFRNRVLFPVSDRRGRVVAFGGRILEGDGPKYINSPDHPLFHKGQLLYGLSRARMAANQGHTVVVAEGYMDVIALVRAGFQAAVAPLGTALTEAQLQELWKITKVPVLCFDGDEAGRRAAWRAADRALPLLQPDHSVRIAYLGAGEDPDSLIASGGTTAMRSVLQDALPLSEVLWQRALWVQQTDTPEGRAGLKAALDREAGAIADPTVRDFYRSEFQARVRQAFPWAGGRTQHSGAPPGTSRRPLERRVSGPAARRPNRGGSRTPILLALLVNHPALSDEVAEWFVGVDMPDAGLEAVRRDLVARMTENPRLEAEALFEQLCDAGHRETLDRLLSGHLHTIEPRARRSASLEQARAAWAEISRRVELDRLQQELHRAGQALGAETTEVNSDRVLALHAELSQAEDDDLDAL